MSSKLSHAVTFLVFLLLAAVIQWPAAWFQGRIAQASGGRWDISGAEGTVWNGGATLLHAAGGDGRWRVVQNLRWKLVRNELWRGRLAVETTFEQGGALVRIDATGMSLAELDTRVPVSALAGLIAGPAGRYGWTGTLLAHAREFRCTWSRRDCAGDIEILWQDAGMTEIPGPGLGSYRIRIVGEGPSVHFDLATQKGRLQIAGKGEIDAGGMRFTGDASATGDDAGRLEAQLRTIGRPGGTAGKYVIEYREVVSSR